MKRLDSRERETAEKGGRKLGQRCLVQGKGPETEVPAGREATEHPHQDLNPLPRRPGALDAESSITSTHEATVTGPWMLNPALQAASRGHRHFCCSMPVLSDFWAR